MRIETLLYNNVHTQGAPRRAWLRQHTPQHLEHCRALMLRALQLRQNAASRSTLVLGAGACTEVPLEALARASDEVVLVDLDLASLEQGRAELTSSGLRRRVRVLECDISGGISANLKRLLDQQPWITLIAQGAQAVFDAAARCLELTSISDPPELDTIMSGEFGVVVSSLLLSQLYSYPLLDILDTIQRLAPDLLGEQERHRRYQDAAQAFRIRVIQSHLHLLRTLVDRGGCAVLLCDVRGFVFTVHGTDHDAAHRRVMPLVPRTLPDLVRAAFTVVEEAHWEWLTDLPEKERPGRGYEVAGYVLDTSASATR